MRRHPNGYLDIYDRYRANILSGAIKPGGRVGYIVVPASLQPRFMASAMVSRAGQSILVQKILARFVSEGHFFRHLKKMRPLYRERGIAVKALSDWYHGVQKKSGLVIGFSNIRSEREAVDLLAKVKDLDFMGSLA